MKIGVLGVQGAVSEHITAIQKAMAELNLQGEAFWLKDKAVVPDLDALILPGGESTTITRLSHEAEITLAVQEKDIPILGTCAGLIMLATDSDGPKLSHLSLIDMSVARNTFGRQSKSSEATLDAWNLPKFPGVFIRAPTVSDLRDKQAKPIAEFQNEIVGVQKNNIIALSFHPELTNDLRIHKKFLGLVK